MGDLRDKFYNWASEKIGEKVPALQKSTPLSDSEMAAILQSMPKPEESAPPLDMPFNDPRRTAPRDNSVKGNLLAPDKSTGTPYSNLTTDQKMGAKLGQSPADMPQLALKERSGQLRQVQSPPQETNPPSLDPRQMSWGQDEQDEYNAWMHSRMPDWQPKLMHEYSHQAQKQVIEPAKSENTVSKFVLGGVQAAKYGEGAAATTYALRALAETTNPFKLSPSAASRVR